MKGGHRGWLVAVVAAGCLLVGACTASASHVEEGPEDGLNGVTVLIVRHAEKPRFGRGLSDKGVERAQAYASYFTPLHQCGYSLQPARLIAARNSLASKRSYLTLQPLGEKLGLPVEHEYAKDQPGELVDSLRRHNTAPVVLIAWHHGHLDKLTEAFGGTSPELLTRWPNNVFNWMMVLQFDAHGQLDESRSRVIHERALPDDLATEDGSPFGASPG